MEVQLLKPGEVAAILQISRAKAYQLMKRGDIRTVRIGTLVRVKKSDLEQYIADCQDKNDSHGIES